MVILESNRVFFLINLIFLIVGWLFIFSFGFFQIFISDKCFKVSEMVFVVLILLFYLIFILIYLGSYFKIILDKSLVTTIFPLYKSKTKSYLFSEIDFVSIVEVEGIFKKRSFKEYQIAICCKLDEKRLLVYSRQNQIANFKKELDVIGIKVL